MSIKFEDRVAQPGCFRCSSMVMIREYFTEVHVDAYA